MKRRAIITDLDGTLLSGNSMRIFMRSLPLILLTRTTAPSPESPKNPPRPTSPKSDINLVGALKSLWWIALRSLRLVSHKTMKWHLTKIAKNNLTDSDWTALAKKMAEFVNPVVKDIIESRQKKPNNPFPVSSSEPSAQSAPSAPQIIIATAAPAEYAIPLCRILGYDSVIATEFTPVKFDYEEMRGESKLRAIRVLLEREDLQLDTFLTDHYDDCPTVEAFPGETIIVNPSERHEALFREIGVTRFCHVSRRDGSCR